MPKDEEAEALTYAERDKVIGGLLRDEIRDLLYRSKGGEIPTVKIHFGEIARRISKKVGVPVAVFPVDGVDGAGHLVAYEVHIP